MGRKDANRSDFFWTRHSVAVRLADFAEGLQFIWSGGFVQLGRPVGRARPGSVAKR
jgi:hypothetical protein